MIKQWFRRLSTVAVSAVVMLVVAVPAFAAADEDTVTAVTGPLTTVKDTALAILAAVAAVAILLFAGIYAWRYGKQVFKIIAK